MSDDALNRVGRLTGEQATVLATTAAFTFVLMRILAISRLNRETTLGLVNAAGVASVVLGSLAAALPVLIGLFGAISLIWRTPRWFMRPIPRLIFAGSFFVIASIFMEWFMFALFVVMILPNAVRRPAGETRGTSSRTMMGVAFATILVTSILQRPWFPGEIVRFTDGTRSEGYVVDDSEDWLTILRDEDRTLEYRRAEDVAQRTVCRFESSREDPTVLEALGLVKLQIPCSKVSTTPPSVLPSP